MWLCVNKTLFTKQAVGQVPSYSLLTLGFSLKLTRKWFIYWDEHKHSHSVSG